VKATEGAVVTPGGRVVVAVRGAGPRLLLVHGLTANGTVWNRVIERLQERFALVVPDLLGRGASRAEPLSRFRLADETERLRAVAQAYAPGPFVLVGHSHGAALALALAARTPRCRGLCLLDPVTPWTKRPLALELLRSGTVRRALAPLLFSVRIPVARLVLRRRVFGDPDAVDEALVRRYADPYGSADRATTLLRILADWRPGELSPQVAPRPGAVVLTGELDRRAPPALAGRLAERLACPLRVVRGAGHALPEEAPDEVARAIETVAARPSRS
jgi:magnesium chelatase accessory protein